MGASEPGRPRGSFRLVDGVVVGVGTERLTMHLLCAGDVDDLVALGSDRAVMRYLTGGRPTIRGEAEGRLARASEWTWVACRRSGGFVGWFSLKPTKPDERELGYRLRSEDWGQGLATEGAGALVDMAFTHLGVSMVWAQTMTVNIASRRVMEKVGLVYQRTFFGDWPEKIPGSEKGDVAYELTRQEWLAMSTV